MCVEKENSSVMSSVYKVMTRIDKSKYEEWGRGRERKSEREREDILIFLSRPLHITTTIDDNANALTRDKE